MNETKERSTTFAKLLLGEDDSGTILTYQSGQDMANKFSTYFKDNINKIRDALDRTDSSYSDPLEVQCNVQHEMNNFEPATEQEIRALIMTSTSKSYAFDPAPEGGG